MARKPNKSKVEQRAKRNPAALNIDGRYLKKGEAEKYSGASDAEKATFQEEVTARALSQPEVRAAATIQKYDGDTININALVDELRKQVAEVNGGNMRRPEAMLVAQAHTLDALFSNLARRSQSNSSAGYVEAAEGYLRLALRAQSQCRATLETLATIKNPPIVYARQANVTTGPQQVNNGIPARARETEIEQSKLLEQSHGERLDTGTAGAASGFDSDLAAVGAVHRAENPGREG